LGFLPCDKNPFCQTFQKCGLPFFRFYYLIWVIQFGTPPIKLIGIFYISYFLCYTENAALKSEKFVLWLLQKKFALYFCNSILPKRDIDLKKKIWKKYFYGSLFWVGTYVETWSSFHQTFFLAKFGQHALTIRNRLITIGPHFLTRERAKNSLWLCATRI